jgi:putative sigma-54 modulation protein
MQISFTGKQSEVSEALRRYAERKLQKLERQLRQVTSAHLVHSIERKWHEVDITLTADGAVFRGEGRSGNDYNSIDIAVTRLEEQIKSRKGKIIDRAHGRTPQGRPPQPELEVAARGELEAQGEEAATREVRSKRVRLTPMSVDEAIDELELLAYQFLLFANAETGQLNVVYKRDQGDYGLIEPEY